MRKMYAHTAPSERPISTSLVSMLSMTSGGGTLASSLSKLSSTSLECSSCTGWLENQERHSLGDEGNNKGQILTLCRFASHRDAEEGVRALERH